MRKRLRASAQRDKPVPFRVSAAGSTVRIEAAEGDKLGTFAGNAYTGKPMRPMGWYGRIIVELSGVRIPSQTRPVLRQHDHEQIVGHTTAIKITKEGIEFEGVFSGEKQHVDKVVVPARNQFPWQLSIGADPVRTEYLEAGETTTVNGIEVTGPLTISRETELGEISFVPEGADGDTSVVVNASKGPFTMWKLALKARMAELRAAGQEAPWTDEQIDGMSDADARVNAKKSCMEDEEDVDAAADDDEDEDDEEEKPKAKKTKSRKTKSGRFDASDAAKALRVELRKIHAEERQRSTEITTLCQQYGNPQIDVVEAGHTRKVNLADHALLNGWGIHQVKAQLLDVVQNDRPTAGVPGGLGYVVTPPQLSEPVLEAALLHACRHTYKLEHEDFYFDVRPDTGQKVRRVQEHIQQEVKAQLASRYTDQVRQAAHDLFANQSHKQYVGAIGPQMVFRLGFAANNMRHLSLSWNEPGIRSMMTAWDYLEKRRLIEAEGASNMSISNVLANVQNKFALQGYLFTEQAWREFCAIRPVNDFKPTKTINLLGNAMYQQVGTTGELKNLVLGDQAFANQAAPYGIIGTIPYTHLVSDDLGMLSQVPMIIGRGAGLALNDNIWTLMAGLAAGTINADDGNAFFRTGTALTDANKKAGKAYNLNKITGAGSALLSSSLQTLKAAFDNQVDPFGFPLGFDGAMPVVLHGPSNWVTATELATYRELVYGGATAAKQPQGNVWAGKFKPVESRYIENSKYVNSTTAWFIFFNPAAIAAVEVCFLGGVDTPAVLQAGPDYQFDKLGISLRGTMPFGSNQQNFRGAAYSAGA